MAGPNTFSCNVFSSNRSHPTERIHQEVGKVQLAMQKNFEAALSNIEKADDIADRTDALANKAKMFHDLGKQVHYNERCKNYKMYAIVGVSLRCYGNDVTCKPDGSRQLT